MDEWPVTRPKIEPNADQRAFAAVVVPMWVALVDAGMPPHHASVLIGTWGATAPPDGDGS